MIFEKHLLNKSINIDTVHTPNVKWHGIQARQWLEHKQKTEQQSNATIS